MNTRERSMTVALSWGANESGHDQTLDRKSQRRRGLTLIEMLVVMLIILVLCSILLPAVQQAREGARRYSCRNNLMQLGLALRSYESVHDTLPPGSVNRSRPIKNTARGYHVGWIVRILPHLEQTSRFNQYDFSAGVYDKKNTNAVAARLTVLHCPSSQGSGSYAGCHHDVESPIDIDNSGVLFLNRCISQDDITDGISHTIFVGEKGDGDLFGWASGTRDTLRNTGAPITSGRGFSAVSGVQAVEPADLLYVGGFGSYHSAGANFLFGDGSVRFLTDSMAMPVFQQLGSRADGELPGDGF